MQVTRTFKLGVASLLVAAAWPASAGLVTTINTSALEANARLDFSTDAVQAMNGVGISRTALGTTKAIGTGGVSFNMPVTSATTRKMTSAPPEALVGRNTSPRRAQSARHETMRMPPADASSARAVFISRGPYHTRPAFWNRSV